MTVTAPSTETVKHAMRKELVPEWFLVALLVGELAFLAWLLITPTAYLKPRAAAPVPQAKAVQVQVKDDAVVGGGLAQPVVAPMAAQDGKAGKDGKAKQADGADAAKQGGRVAVAAGSDLVVHLAIRGAAGDTLVGATSPAVASVALAGADGKPAASIPMTGDATADLALGSLAAAIDKGGSVPVTLTFEKAGDVQLDVPVWRNAAAAADNPGKPVAAGDLTVEQAWAEPAS